MTATPSHCTMAATTRTEMMCVPPAGFAEWVASTHIFRIADSIGRTAPDFHLLLGYDITDTLCSPGLRYCGSRATTPPGSECSAFSWAQCCTFIFYRARGLANFDPAIVNERCFPHYCCSPSASMLSKMADLFAGESGDSAAAPGSPASGEGGKKKKVKKEKKKKDPNAPKHPMSSCEY